MPARQGESAGTPGHRLTVSGAMPGNEARTWKTWSNRLRRIALPLALAAVAGLAFAGYLSPEMQLQWENLMALCGF